MFGMSIIKKLALKVCYKFWKPFEAHAVKRVLQDYPTHVHDLGGGHSIYEDENLLNEVKAVLELNEHFIKHPSNKLLSKYIVLRRVNQ